LINVFEVFEEEQNSGIVILRKNRRRLGKPGQAVFQH